jgi:hypothetical protein
VFDQVVQSTYTENIACIDQHTSVTTAYNENNIDRIILSGPADLKQRIILC